jgi:histidyl-tRNA synthetase
MTKGRKREHYQWNLDIVGEESVLAEVEVLGAACDALRRMGLSDADFKVHVSNRALLSELLAASGIPAEKHAQVFLALDKRGKMPDEELARMMKDNGLTDADVAKTFDILNVKTLDEAAALVAPDSPAIANLRELFRLAGIAGFAACLEFDISVIRGLSYYTGIVFECFDVKREFRAIFGGGRYDNLLTAIGGDPTPAVGLGFGDVVVAEVLKDLLGESFGAERDGVAVGYMFPEQRDAATALAARLRADGRAADLALSPMKPKNFFRRAGEGTCSHAVFIGPDDVAAGEARIKDLATRVEERITL